MELSRIQLWLICFLFLGGVCMPAFAESDNELKSVSSTTQELDNYCKIKVRATPQEGAYVSGGANYRVNGNQVYISTSAKNTEDYTYTFLYWTLNGKKTSYGQSFYYTPTKGEYEFVAHYDKQEAVFDPDNPLDPSSSNIKRDFHLYLTSNIDGACSFNMDSGSKVEEKKSIYLGVNYQSAFYQFIGWKLNGKIFSTKAYLNFTMPSSTTTLEACFNRISIDPDSPIDPNCDVQDVKIIGDADNSGKLDMDDVTAISKFIMGETIEGFNKEKANVNNDNDINVVDLVLIIKALVNTKY